MMSFHNRTTVTTAAPQVVNPNTGETNPRQGTKQYNEWRDDVSACEDERQRITEKYGEQQTKIVTISGERVEVEMDLDPEQYEIVNDGWGEVIRRKSDV